MTWRHLSDSELTEYVDGATAATSVGQVEEHLRGCDECAEALASLRRVIVALGRLDAVMPPTSIRQQVMAKLAPDLGKGLACRQALPLLQEHFDRCLSPLLAVRLQRHLDSCAHCRSELAALATAAGLVRSLSPRPAPIRVRQRVATARSEQAHTVRLSTRRRPALAIAGVIAAGALALVLRPVLQHPLPPADNRAAARLPSATTPAAPQARPAETAARSVIRVAQAEIGPSKGMSSKVSAVSREPLVRSAKRPFLRAVEIADATRAARRPSPSPFVTMTVSSSRSLPAAIRTLKAVAKSARPADWEAERAMAQAAERLAIVSSEELLNRMPDSIGFSMDERSIEHPVGQPPAVPSGDREPSENSASVPSGPDTAVPGSLA